jgi:diguanylate cyclase (GGDEF)-like protein
MLAIAECIWIVGAKLEIFKAFHELSLTYGLSDLIMLGFFMSFALIAGSLRKSFALRREVRARTRAESRAQTLARHDALTGLPNRRLLLEHLEQAARKDRPYAIFVVDLDRFKPINDVHGHAAGDAVLCEVAGRLASLLPKGGFAARFGGDEFALLVPCEPQSDEPARLAQRVITALAAPITWNTTQVEVGATIGIALLPSDSSDPGTLLRSADIAMYRGKRDGRGTYRFFESSMDHELQARAMVESELRAAISDGNIRPYYQPLISLSDQQLLGFEVLARWYHPRKGVLSPNLFIPIAEDTGLIADLSYSILRQACLDAKTWPPHLQLAVNISPYQLQDKWLPERILAILTETGFPPSRLEVEITETALVHDIEGARHILKSLQNIGVSIALDDFGTGYSSLYHLREFKFDKIKIDQSYVQALGTNPESTKIVNAIIGLGKSLGLLTTAEGVETKANLEYLTGQGCSFGQGFLFGAPVPANMVPAINSSYEAQAADFEPCVSAA